MLPTDAPDGADGPTKCWNPASALLDFGRDIGLQLQMLAQAGQGPVHSPALAEVKQGNGTVAFGTAAGSVRLLDASSGDLLAKIEHRKGGSLPVLCVCCSADGSLLASGCRDRTWKLWDTSGMRELLCGKGHTDAVWSIAMSDWYLGTGGYDKTIILWNLRTGAEERRLLGHTSGISSLAFNPDSSRLASGSWDESIRVWDPSTGALVRLIRVAHRAAVCSLAFFPDGYLLASAGGGGQAKVWDTLTAGHAIGHEPAEAKDAPEEPEALQVLRGHTGQVRRGSAARVTRSRGPGDLRVRTASVPRVRKRCAKGALAVQVNSVAVSADGVLIATGGADRSVRVWDAADGAERFCLPGHTCTGGCICRDGHAEPGCPLVGHRGIVQAVGFAPDGRTLASASIDGAVKVWDGAAGALLHETAGGAKVFGIACGPELQRASPGAVAQAGLPAPGCSNGRGARGK